ncbi:DUF6298 domain-containing protein [Actinocrispum wychmicini]|uniref:Uncharacterized protein DUF4038 n=1 Tax=Actinocrispum wychmicini TaxID=1213861 RepID=A0A4R2J7B8_9PSEU|nr:DUF4038 domain-containing protein [Actinocrispum wychmicini]TCO54981.1 uncharacterized protein DUF4038 [Actinocrispum wychmicini]
MPRRRPGIVALAICLLLIGVTIVGETTTSTTSLPSAPVRPALGPLKVSQNGRYFATPDGQPVLLTGAHTWQNLQDTGRSDPPPTFDYGKYLDILRLDGHNFFRLWTWEQARYSNEIESDDYFYSPLPYPRTGPGTAVDGRPKFDVDRFDQRYFDRLRDRVQQAGAKGVYVSVMLFNGWSIEACKGQECKNNPWRGHPFNPANNVNGVDGGSAGIETLANPAVTRRQEAYVQKVLDTVKDLGNVLFEITNEGPPDSVAWQYHMIDFIKARDAHPVGMTSTYPDGHNQDLLASPADWISPNGDLDNPPPTTGAKVVLADTDHLCGLCGDREWPWKSFTRGENPIYMDAYDGAYGIGGSLSDNNATAIRANLGYVRRYALKMDLLTAVPEPELCSTRFCLAGPDEYLVFSPNGGFALDVNVRGYTGEWFSLDSRETTRAEVDDDRFTPPFTGPAVLYLKRS